MTELVPHQTQEISLRDQWQYAETVTNSSLLPQAYRGNAANALVAIGLGQAMGLSPAESLYRIDVIQGKPTASAELIASNVRKAGHKLRVRGDENSCTATIIRADDPDYEYSVTRDTNWARNMGLLNKDNYKKQPGTMLQWRAITAVARLACSEALYGVAYTPDEMTDLSGNRQEQPRRQGGYGITANMPAPAPRPEDVVEVTHEEQPEPEALVFASRSQQSRLGKALDGIGVTENTEKAAEVQRWASEQGITRDVTKSGHLTVDEIETMITWLESMTTTEGEPVMEWDTQEVPS